MSWLRVLESSIGSLGTTQSVMKLIDFPELCLNLELARKDHSEATHEQDNKDDTEVCIKNWNLLGSGSVFCEEVKDHQNNQVASA